MLTAQPTQEHLAVRSHRLAVALDRLDGEQRGRMYADGYLESAGGDSFYLAADHLWDDRDQQVVVCDDGAAARWRPERGEWVPIDPGCEELTDQGLALWGSEGFGYSMPDLALSES